MRGSRKAGGMMGGRRREKMAYIGPTEKRRRKGMKVREKVWKESKKGEREREGGREGEEREPEALKVPLTLRKNEKIKMRKIVIIISADNFSR